MPGPDIPVIDAAAQQSLATYLTSFEGVKLVADKAKISIGQATEFVKKYAAEVLSAGAGAKMFGASMTGLNGTLAANGNQLSGLSGAVSYITDKYHEFKNASDETQDSIAGVGVGLATLLTKFGDMPALTDSSTTATRAFNAHIVELSASIAGLISKIPGFEKIAQATAKFYENAASVKALENSFLTAAVAGGNFFSLVGEDSGNVADALQQATIRMTKESGQSANLLGITAAESMNRVKQLMTSMPGLPKETGKIYEQMENISQVARSLGVDYTVGLKVAADALGLFGKKLEGIEGEKRFAVMGKAAGNLKIPFESIKGVVEGVDSQFGMWGSQMEGTVSILGKVHDALNDAGVGFKGQVEIVQKLEQGIQSLALPMKAFIGMSAGLRGPGGMVGAGLEVERMMQRGDMKGIVDMLQSTIEKRSGVGRTLTLGETEGSPELSGAFIRQRMLLQQASGVSDTGTLNRIMEAMSKSRLGGGAGVEAEKALQDALTGGRQLTESQTNVPLQQLKVQEEMAGYLERMAQREVERTTHGFARGTGEGTYEGLLSKAEAQRRLPESKEKETAESLNRKAGAELLKMPDIATNLGGSLYKVVSPVIEEVFGKFLSANEDKIKTLKAKPKLTKEETEELTKLTKEQQTARETQGDLSTQEGFTAKLLGSMGFKLPGRETGTRGAGGMEKPTPERGLRTLPTEPVAAMPTETIRGGRGGGLEVRSPQTYEGSTIKFEPAEVRLIIESAEGKALGDIKLWMEQAQSILKDANKS